MDERIERLRQVREALGFNQHQMAEACGLSFSAYSCVERGIRGLQERHLLALEKNTDADAGYIRTGEGRPLKHSEADRMAALFGELDPERQALILGLMESWLKK